jgi:histidyl-tRNA synthetase
MSERKIYKPRPVSGFPEWLPEVRRVEQLWLDHIRKVFESYGYCSIETPAVEELDVISAKGGDGGADVDKEIYVLERLHKKEGDKDARLALHFDQTVPLARYVAQHFNGLVFPFKRYQMQKVWRGERPQLGRSREFMQCDIDIINVDSLPIHFDAEIPAVIYEALKGLNIGKFQIRISNRKILLGLLESMNISDTIAVTRTVDKLDKIGAEQVERILKSECGLNDSQAQSVLQLATAIDLKSVKGVNSQMEEGLQELQFVMEQLKHLPPHAIKADLSIVRGLDYYTGTVYETRLLDIPEFTGSICSGGRYEDLASNYINKKLPGVGISIGFTRLFEVLHHYGYIKGTQLSPADILMVLPSEEKRAEASSIARALRERGFNVELYHSGKKSIGDQLKYASKKHIPFVWFPDSGEVKNMATGEQAKADVKTWKPV